MKSYSADALTALAAGSVRSVGAIKIATSPAFRVWGGYGDLTLGGETYTGIGDAGLVSVTGAQLGGTEDGIDLVLSDVDPAAIALIEASDARDAPVTIWRNLFDSSGTVLLDGRVFDRGRLDKVTPEETVGGTATIRGSVETAARGLGRFTGRMRSDADQRMIDANDGGLSRVTQAAELTLAWGGLPPTRAANALPTAGAAGGGGGGLGGDFEAPNIV